MKKITGVLVNVDRNEISIQTLPANLEGYYKALDCTCIDIVSRRIGGEEFDIICDDEGLLKAHPIISAISSDRQPMLVGNLFIVKYSGAGDIRSLDDREAAHVLDNEATVRDGKTRRLVIHPCDY